MNVLADLLSRCPHCKMALTYVDNPPMPVGKPGGNQWNGIAYCCPHCRSILGIVIDPIALRNETIAGVVAQLRA